MVRWFCAATKISRAMPSRSNCVNARRYWTTLTVASPSKIVRIATASTSSVSVNPDAVFRIFIVFTSIAPDLRVERVDNNIAIVALVALDFRERVVIFTTAFLLHT